MRILDRRFFHQQSGWNRRGKAAASFPTYLRVLNSSVVAADASAIPAPRQGRLDQSSPRPIRTVGFAPRRRSVCISSMKKECESRPPPAVMYAQNGLSRSSNSPRDTIAPSDQRPRPMSEAPSSVLLRAAIRGTIFAHPRCAARRLLRDCGLADSRAPQNQGPGLILGPATTNTVLIARRISSSPRE